MVGVHLVGELPRDPQYPAQGRTLFVDLETRSVQSGYTPRHLLQTLLSGRGANMYYLYRLLDETLYPLHPDIPLIFGSGVLTGIVPSAAMRRLVLAGGTIVSSEARTIITSPW